MPTINRTNSVSPKYKKQPKGHFNKYYGMYVGIVKDNVDPQRNGSLRVWIPEFGSTPDDQGAWIKVAYCSPFAGATQPEFKPDGTIFNNTQTSYGLWFVPPDLEVKVAVMFSNGDISTGYWFGCLFDQYMNNMVPAISSSTANASYPGKMVPVAEYNKADKSTNVQSPTRPVHEQAFNSIADQGLINDDIRGTTTSSARRDDVPQVYGISTPGPRNGNSKNRLGGSRLIMDDGDGTEYIGLRTRSGTFLKLDDSNGLIYAINRDGTAWLQMDANGNVDVFGASSISVRSGEDINFRADRNINIEAGNDIHIKASKDYSGTDYVASPFGGSGGNIKIEANNKFDLTVYDDTKMNLKGQLDFKIEKNAIINVVKDLHITSNNTFHTSNLNTEFKVGGDHILTIDKDSNISISGTSRLFTKGNALYKSDSDLKITALSNMDIFSTNSIKQTSGNEFDIVSGSYIRGTTGGTVSWNGTPAKPTTAITEAVVTATPALQPVTPAAIDMATKTSVLPSFSSKFERDTQLVKTIVSRLMTFEPCPEHMVKATDQKTSKYAWYSKKLVNKPKAKIYKVGAVSTPDTPAPPENVVAETKEEIIVPVISEKFECGNWVTPEVAYEGPCDRNGRIIKSTAIKINPRELYDGMFKEASDRYGVPSCILSRLASKESGYNKIARNYISADDRYCAYGIMQIVPRWHPLVKDPYNPVEAIPYGAKYLRENYDRFGSWEKALAAYNWGPEALAKSISKHKDKWMSHLPAETLDYITKIGKDVGIFI